MIYLNNRKINEIRIGGGGSSYDWSKIGYAAEPSFIKEGYDYAIQMKKRWDEDTSDQRYSYFANDEKVVFAPALDLTNMRNLDSLFYNCPNLLMTENFDFANSNINNIYSLFTQCPKLSEIKVSNTENIYRINLFDYNNSSLKKVTPFSVKNVNDINFNNESLQEMELLNFGEGEKLTRAYFRLGKWGTNSEKYPNASQSLINTFTNAFDRKTAGYQNCDINLAPVPFIILSQDLKKEICNKGYTFNNQDYNTASEDMRIHYTQDTNGSDYGYGLGIGNENYGTRQIDIKIPEVNEYVNFLTDIRGGITKITMPSNTTNLIKLPNLNYTNLDNMFNNTRLKKIDLSKINLKNITSVRAMFSWSHQLEEINLSGLQTEKITSYNAMFDGCSNLKRVILNGCSCEVINWIKARIAEARDASKNVQIISDAQCEEKRWRTTDDYICNGVDKYQKEIEEISTDFGQTWSPTGQERQGKLIQSNVTDCGGKEPPILDAPLTIVSNNTPYKISVNRFSSDEKTIEVNESPFERTLNELGIGKAISFVRAFENISMVSEVTLPTCNSTKFAFAFIQCGNLLKADLSNVNIQACSDFTQAFMNCGQLSEINLDNWIFNEELGIHTNSMFLGCRSLKTIYLRNSNEFSKLIIDNALKEDGLTSQVTVITE